MKKQILYPVRYTVNVFVHADKIVRNSEGSILGQYAGCELDNFASELNNRTFTPPDSDGGSGFCVVYMFLKKDNRYYEMNWSGELKEISFSQLFLGRLKRGHVRNIFRFFSRISFSFKLGVV